MHEEWLGIERLQYDLAMVKLRREVDLPPVELADSSENITNGHFHVIETDQEDVEYQQHTEATYMNFSMCNSRFFWTRSIRRDVVCASTEYGRCISKANFRSEMVDGVGRRSWRWVVFCSTL